MYYCVQENPPLDHYPKPDGVHFLPPCFFENLVLMLANKHRCSKWSIPSVFPVKSCIHIISLICAMCPAKVITFYLISVIRVKNSEKYTFSSCSLCNLILFLAGSRFVSQVQIFIILTAL